MDAYQAELAAIGNGDSDGYDGLSDDGESPKSPTQITRRGTLPAPAVASQWSTASLRVDRMASSVPLGPMLRRRSGIVSPANAESLCQTLSDLSSKRKTVVFHDPQKLLHDLREDHRRARRSSHQDVLSAPASSSSSSAAASGDATTTPSAAASTSVRVAVRIRPMLRRDLQRTKQVDALRLEKDGVTLSPVTEELSPELRAKASGRPGRSYTYDYVFDSRSTASKPATQSDIHAVMGESLVKEAMAGYNACLFAYGQTGSGKTHTMIGHSQTPEERGILPRVLEGIFAEAEKIAGKVMTPTAVSEGAQNSQTASVKISFIEIYNEMIQDLLVPPRQRKEQSLSIRYNPTIGIIIVDLTEAIATSIDEAQELVDFGMKMRSVGATCMNSRSSRAHTIFTLRLEQTSTAGEMKIAQVQIVDLAGREQEKTSGDDRDRMRERTFINRSLFHLSQCVANLSNKSSIGCQDFTFRNSKLTMVLANSLGRNSMTTMLAAVSPAAADLEETISTLRFASAVKLIKTEAKCNAVNKRDLVSELQSEIERLKAEQVSAPDRALVEKVQQLEALCDQYRESLEQEQLMSKQLAKDRKQALEELGLSVSSDHASLSVGSSGQSVPYLVNLSEDPFLEGCLMYFLKKDEEVTIGSAAGNRIRLDGLGIAAYHCSILHQDAGLVLRMGPPGGTRRPSPEPVSGEGSSRGIMPLPPRTFVNGQRCLEGETDLRHRDRVLLGHAFAFRLVIPSEASKARTCSSSTSNGDNTCLSSPRSPRNCSDQSLERALAEVNDCGNVVVRQLGVFCAGLPPHQRLQFERDVNISAALVDEADLIASLVRPEEGLVFRLQVIMDVLSSTSACTAGTPSLVVAVMAGSRCSSSVLEEDDPCAEGGGDLPQKEEQAQRLSLRFVWSLEKFRRRLEVMRDVYEECQKRGLEEVRRQLRREPYADPWKEIGNGEVQMLLQGLGTAAANNDGESTHSSLSGSSSKLASSTGGACDGKAATSTARPPSLPMSGVSQRVPEINSAAGYPDVSNKLGAVDEEIGYRASRPRRPIWDASTSHSVSEDSGEESNSSVSVPGCTHDWHLAGKRASKQASGHALRCAADQWARHSDGLRILAERRGGHCDDIANSYLPSYGVFDITDASIRSSLSSTPRSTSRTAADWGSLADCFILCKYCSIVGWQCLPGCLIGAPALAVLSHGRRVAGLNAKLGIKNRCQGICLERPLGRPSAAALDGCACPCLRREQPAAKHDAVRRLLQRNCALGRQETKQEPCQVRRRPRGSVTAESRYGALD
eukprot:TRINITY_DN100746_c0_g1_i2.p1 TRINITY_DN100746_c0_g1~~TRINITY_DN100746_c0_g1_i2.p1  ORF type:complete len:1284 (-),score=263.40 TRINITY_DN100746_c0_g1_i2:251-4102(-)